MSDVDEGSFEAQMREDVLRHGGWYLPDYAPGQDDLWDQLGKDWRAVDGIRPDVRVYFRWRTDDTGRTHISGLCIGGESISTDAVRAVPIGRLENLAAAAVRRMRPPSEKLPPLTRKRGEDPEQFSGKVAIYYRQFAAASHSPTKDIAEHSGVPIGTVRSWIREARLRGKLPPAKQGRVG